MGKTANDATRNLRISWTLFVNLRTTSRPTLMPQSQSPLESVNLDELLEQAIGELAKAKENVKHSCERNTENVSLHESVVLKLSHIKERRLKDSGIIH